MNAAPGEEVAGSAHIIDFLGAQSDSIIRPPRRRNKAVNSDDRFWNLLSVDGNRANFRRILPQTVYRAQTPLLAKDERNGAPADAETEDRSPTGTAAPSRSPRPRGSSPAARRPTSGTIPFFPSASKLSHQRASPLPI